MGDIILITGISGVGKTTLLSKILPEFADRINLINFGDFMFNKAKDKFNLSSRDELAKYFHLREYKELQYEVAREIKKIASQERKTTLLDTHLVLLGYNGVVISGTDRKILEILKPKAAIIITAPPGVVLYRRFTDPKRKRIPLTLREIERWERLIEAHAVDITFEGIPVFFVENDYLDKAIERLKNVLSSLL